MEANKIIIYLCGLYSFGFAIFHIFFWQLFDWKNDLKNLTFVNRAIIQIANLRLIYFLLFVGTICFAFPEDLTGTTFGRFFLSGISIFWLGRTIEQFVFLRVHNKMVHILTILFIAGTILYALPLFLYELALNLNGKKREIQRKDFDTVLCVSLTNH